MQAVMPPEPAPLMWRGCLQQDVLNYKGRLCHTSAGYRCTPQKRTLAGRAGGWAAPVPPPKFDYSSIIWAVFLFAQVVSRMSAIGQGGHAPVSSHVLAVT